MVSLSVCRSIGNVRKPAKTAEPIAITFGIRLNHVGPKNTYYGVKVGRIHSPSRGVTRRRCGPSSLTTCLARAACMPRVLYFACVNFFFNKHLSKQNSGSSGQIFTRVSPYGKYLIVGGRLDIFSNTLPCQSILGSKLAKSDYSYLHSYSPGIPKRIAISPF